MNAFSGGGQKRKNPLFLEHMLIEVSLEHSFESKQTYMSIKKLFWRSFLRIEIYTTQFNKKIRNKSKYFIINHFEIRKFPPFYLLELILLI